MAHQRPLPFHSLHWERGGGGGGLVMVGGEKIFNSIINE